MIHRVLVIDDDEAVRKAFVLALEGTGFQADTAPSGERGVQMAGEMPYDLIYLDLRMPGMDGVETLRALREAGTVAPVYLITAFWEEFADALRDAQEEGLGFELMKKPLGIRQIVSLTRGILGEPAVY